MIQVLDKYGKTHSEEGNVVVLDKYGNIKRKNNLTKTSQLINDGSDGTSFYLQQTDLNSSNIISALGFTPEDVANKVTDFTTINDTLYPSVKAVKDYVDANTGGIPFDIIKDYPNQILMSAAGTAMNYFGTYAQTFTGTQSNLLIGGGGISYRKVVSAASAGSNANFYDAGIYRVTGTKGFYYRARIKNEDSVNIPTGRFSYGFSGTAIMGNINPSTYTQSLLSFGADNTDTNCQIMYKLNLGATTKINLGATMPKTQLDEYVIEFWRLNGTTIINYRITNLTTSVVVSGSFVFAFAGLALGHFRNNETVASSCGFAIRRVELYISD